MFNEAMRSGLNNLVKNNPNIKVSQTIIVAKKRHAFKMKVHSLLNKLSEYCRIIDVDPDACWAARLIAQRLSDIKGITQDATYQKCKLILGM